MKLYHKQAYELSLSVGRKQVDRASRHIQAAAAGMDVSSSVRCRIKINGDSERFELDAAIISPASPFF